MARRVTLSVDPRLHARFVVRDTHIAFAPGALADAVDAELALRHALELSLLQRISHAPGSLAMALAIALLGCRVGAIYAFSRLGDGRLPESWPAWLAETMRLVAVERVSFGEVRALLRDHATQLLALQASELQPSPAQIDVELPTIENLFDQAREVAAPAEFLLTTGGDTRLRLDPVRGLNNYGCSPRPRPWAHTFASSTATSISEPAYGAAEALREELLESALHGPLDSTFSDACEETKRDIRRLCSFPPESDVLLTTSGTDAELYAVFIAAMGSSAPLLNLLVGPDETGSSVGVAASARHFDSVTPLGEQVTKGQLLDPTFDGRIDVEGVPIRESTSRLRSCQDVDSEVERRVDAAVARGCRVLLHILDISKTGVLAPSLQLVSQLRARHPHSVDVVVDACQLRATPDVLARYCAAGYMVILTGSKFVTGPPFAGALVVPESVSERLREVDRVPEGFVAYSTRDEWPSRWRMRDNLSSRRNVGLLLRWRAALWELSAFRSVAPSCVHTILSTFGAAIRNAIERRPYLQLIDSRSIDRGVLGPLDSWDRIQTIFTFTVSLRRSERHQSPASLTELRQIYEWLNQDMSCFLRGRIGDAEIDVAAKCCHVGQPVVVGRTLGVELPALRISAGARLVSGVALGPGGSEGAAARLDQETHDALFILDKLDLVAREFEFLVSAVNDAEKAVPSD